jgi:hypothetical protein
MAPESQETVVAVQRLGKLVAAMNTLNKVVKGVHTDTQSYIVSQAAFFLNCGKYA